MINYEEQYLEQLRELLEAGVPKSDRTGVGTQSVFGRRMELDLRDYRLPVLTTKMMYLKSLTHELLWFISGSTDVAYLKRHGISIWDKWVDPGEPVYKTFGVQRQSRELAAALRRQSPTEPLLEHLSPAQLAQSYREVMKCEPQELVQGSIRNPETGQLVAGTIGPGAYGAQWRDIEDVRRVPSQRVDHYLAKGFSLEGSSVDGQSHFMHRHIDQLQNLISELRTNPDSRRLLLVTFDPRMVDFCALPPCHSFFQVWTRELSQGERVRWVSDKILRETGSPHASAPPTGEAERAYWVNHHKAPTRALSMQLYCRSQDVPVGTPFNVTQYALLAHILAHLCGYVAERLVWVAGDTHLYQNQTELVSEQLRREPLPEETRVWLNPQCTEIDDFGFNDIRIEGYEAWWSAINYPVS